MSEPERRAFEQGDAVFLEDGPRTPLWTVEPDPEGLHDEIDHQAWHPYAQRIVCVTEIEIAGGVQTSLSCSRRPGA